MLGLVYPWSLLWSTLTNPNSDNNQIYNTKTKDYSVLYMNTVVFFLLEQMHSQCCYSWSVFWSQQGLLSCPKWTGQKRVVFVSTSEGTAKQMQQMTPTIPGNAFTGLHGGNTDAKKHPEILIRWPLTKKTDKRQGWAPEDRREIY